MASMLFDVIWRSLLVFGLLIVLTRLVGKKLLSQMNFFDFVIGITIGTVSGAYIVQRIQGMWVLLSPVLLTVFTVGFGYLMLKSLRLRKIFEGEPVVVIQNGKILEKNMTKLRYHLDDLEMQLRNKDIFNLTQVEFAVLEPHGQLSVLKKSQNLPLTPQDVGMSTQYQGLATEIIKDGDVIDQNLRQNNLDFNWLYRELKKQNIDRISDVMLAQLNTDGTLYVDLKDDPMDYVQKVED